MADDRDVPSPSPSPSPSPGALRPDDAVLDELSQVFAQAGAADEHDDEHDDEHADGHDEESGDDPIGAVTDESSENADVAARPGDDRGEPGPTPDRAPAAAPEPIADSGPAPRRTISIGGDDVPDAAAVEPIDARPGPLTTTTPATGSAGPRIVTSVADPGLRLATSRRADDDDDDSTGRDRATISIVGNDGLPDAVYLDDGLGEDADGSNGTVFIDDDGVGDAVAPRDATSTGIEPRLRQRRIGVNRAANRKRLKWLAVGLVVVVVGGGILALLGSGLFAVDSVRVEGDVYTDQERLAAVVDDLEGTPVLLVDTQAAEQQLEAIPWVDDARVRTRFPSSASIEIRERTPVATMRGLDGMFRVLDAEGRVLDVIEGQPVAMVLLAGPGTLDIGEGEFAPIGPASAASLVTKLTPTIRPRVEYIEVTDDGSDLVMVLSPEPVVIEEPFVPPTDPPVIDPANPQVTLETTVPEPVDSSAQTTSIIVRFGSAIGDADHIEKLVRLERKLAELPDRNVTEINVATNEVTEL